MSVNPDGSEYPKPNSNITQKEIKSTISFNLTSRVSEKELREKDINLSFSTVYRQYTQLTSDKRTNNKNKGTGMKKEERSQ